MNVSLARRCLAEFIGTAVLVALGPGAVMVAAKTQAFGHGGVALAFGLAVTIVVAATGHLGAGHINPAATVGFWMRKRFPAREVPAYLAAQCLGAIAASAMMGWIVGPVGNFGATLPSIPIPQAFAVELLYTALLGFVIMAVVTDDRSPAAVAPFAIGATVFAGALVTGPLTGGSFNPARSLGPAILAREWSAHWLYWAAPILGMVAGMSIYEWLTQRGPSQSLG